MKIKAIFFDLDDTLFDYERCHQAATKRIFEDIHKITGTPTELIPIIFEIAQKEVKTQLLWTAASHNKDLYFQKIFEKINNQIKNKIMAKDTVLIYNNYRKTFFSTLKRERYTVYLLKYLKKKWIKTWVITDSSNFVQLNKLIHLWINDKIDVMVSSEEAWMDKPHSSPFLLAMYKLDVKPHECLMVWDSIKRDIEWAQRLWIQWIRINRYHKSNEWVIPSHTVENTTQLYKLIKWLIK